jgi:Cdc6-like AAA superfamily ATPase
MTDEVEKLNKFVKIGEAFSPRAPIDRKTLFAGRLDQLRDAVNTVTQRGQHAVVYGERGVGKTSLANIVLTVFGNQVNKPECGVINCDGTMNFSALWHAILREMHIADGKTLNNLAPEIVTPDDVRHVLQNISKTLIIIDELDRIRDKDLTVQLADTIKNLSDHSVDTTIVLVGVADSVETLIAGHVSIERNLVQIRMPRMSRTELEELIDNGAKLSAIYVSDAAKSRIASLSQGLPHYAHLLCLHAFQNAVTRDAQTVDVEDVRAAITRALGQAQQSVISDYNRAVTSPRKENLYAQVLLACALAKPDNLGYFYAGDVRGPMTNIMNSEYIVAQFSQHLNAFCELERGPILERTGVKRKYRFRFVNPLMQPYVVMNGIQQGLIPEDRILP